MKVKLAEALLRRKELATKVLQLASIKDQKDLFRIQTKRTQAHDSLDDIVMAVPLMSQAEVLGAYDWHARQLRLVDAAIQQANWTTELDVGESVMADYVPPDLTRTTK